MDYEIDFLKSLLFTVSIETVVLFLLFKLPHKSLNINNKLLLLTGFLTTFSTLPYLWFILPMVIKSKLAYTIISEVAAVLVESVIIKELLRISYKRALGVSFICNMTSFLIGLLIKWP
ncbi:MAG: hypothetical protein Q8904_13085 [Bacteroidota bacterium]|nr:hypothetical protein [Bacteroidota bacterium]